MDCRYEQFHVTYLVTRSIGTYCYTFSCRYKFIKADGNLVGSKINGTFTGQIGQIVRKVYMPRIVSLRHGKNFNVIMDFFFRKWTLL